MDNSDKIAIVTVNGTSDLNMVSDDIIGKVMSAASTAVERASTYHLEKAISNVNNAYTTAEYPKISYMYARWLVIRYGDIGNITTEGWDYTKKFDIEHLDDQAKKNYEDKTSMIVTGELLDGLSITGLKETNTSISVTIASQAKYSKDLECGYLFGKYRGVNKKRPFFTGHISTTSTMMYDIFKESLERVK